MIKIMTDNMLNEIISKAKTEMWQKIDTEQKLDRLQSQLYEMDARLMKLERGGIPTLEQMERNGVLFRGKLEEGDYKLIKTTDGWVLQGEDIDEDLKPLERAGKNRAIPVRDCLYPKCEECDNYHGHYCTVPMVVSKQIYRLFEERLYSIEHRLEATEKLITAQILGEREPNAELTDCGWK